MRGHTAGPYRAGNDNGPGAGASGPDATTAPGPEPRGHRLAVGQASTVSAARTTAAHCCTIRARFLSPSSMLWCAPT